MLKVTRRHFSIKIDIVDNIEMLDSVDVMIKQNAFVICRCQHTLKEGQGGQGGQGGMEDNPDMVDNIDMVDNLKMVDSMDVMYMQLQVVLSCY